MRQGIGSDAPDPRSFREGVFMFVQFIKNAGSFKRNMIYNLQNIYANIFIAQGKAKKVSEEKAMQAASENRVMVPDKKPRGRPKKNKYQTKDLNDKQE